MVPFANVMQAIMVIQEAHLVLKHVFRIVQILVVATEPVTTASMDWEVALVLRIIMVQLVRTIAAMYVTLVVMNYAMMELMAMVLAFVHPIDVSIILVILVIFQVAILTHSL